MLIAHNLEHQLLTQQLANSRFLSILLKGEIAKQSSYEIEGFRRVRGVIFLSRTDMDWSRSKVPGLQTLVCRQCLSNRPYPVREQSNGQLRLGFIADFAWWPNRQGWKWLIDEILPKVRRPLMIHLFGRKSQEMPAGDQVVAHGLVPDIEAVWDQVDIMICPILSGAGVSIKLAESLYNRMPVLATTQAVRGLKCSPGTGLAIIDRAEEWVAFLNSSEADRLATQVPSEELSRQFTADRHREKLENFIMNVALRGNGKISRSYKHASN